MGYGTSSQLGWVNQIFPAGQLSGIMFTSGIIFTDGIFLAKGTQFTNGFAAGTSIKDVIVNSAGPEVNSEDKIVIRNDSLVSYKSGILQILTKAVVTEINGEPITQFANGGCEASLWKPDRKNLKSTDMIPIKSWQYGEPSEQPDWVKTFFTPGVVA